MTYYIYNDKLRTAIGFATKRDAILAILNLPNMRYEYAFEEAFIDRNCKKVAFTIENMGMGIYNYYKGDSLSWDDDEDPKVVGPNGTLVSLNKRSRKKR